MRKSSKFYIICILNSFISLLIGVIVYILFREQTYINKLLSFAFHFSESVFIDFLRFYLVDALWAYSLVFSLSIFINEFTAGAISFIFSFVWEIMQKYSVVRGTFDILDILMYLSACIVAVLIIHILKRSYTQ